MWHLYTLLMIVLIDQINMYAKQTQRFCHHQKEEIIDLFDFDDNKSLS